MTLPRRSASLFARLILALVVLMTPLAAAASGPAIPPLTGRVIDNANLLDDWTRNKISSELENFEKQSGTQLVVVTIPDLGGYTIEDWGIALGRGWGIGQKGKNNGLLLMVAPNDHDVRIEVGYGLEGDLPDATAHAIIQKIILPRFRAGDMAGGINAGVDAVIETLGGKPVAALADNSGGSDNGSGQVAAVIPIIFVFFVLVMLLSNLRRRGYRTGYPYYMGYPFYMGGRGIGGGGFSGGGFSGGGFSGGGGSFGGGGASGHW